MIIELSHEKTNNLNFRPGLTQTMLCSHRIWLQAVNFVILEEELYNHCSDNKGFDADHV